RTHRHLVDTQGIRAEFLAEIIRANRVLQRLTHLAVFLVDLFTVVEELAVLLLYLSCWHVDATRIGVGISLDVALVVQATVWLLGGDMAQVIEHLARNASTASAARRAPHRRRTGQRHLDHSGRERLAVDQSSNAHFQYLLLPHH